MVGHYDMILHKKYKKNQLVLSGITDWRTDRHTVSSNPTKLNDFSFSIAVTSKQFFGDPIECDPGHAKVDGAALGKTGDYKDDNHWVRGVQRN